jgi:esterase/lipase superfamily enzyme
MNGVAVYEHFGRPVLVFPAERATPAHDWPSWRAQIAHHLPRFV